MIAGCEPAYFPVVLAAVQALLDPAFDLRGVQTTDEIVAPLLVVNGPFEDAARGQRGWGGGPDWPANAAIGRARAPGDAQPGRRLARARSPSGPGPAGHATPSAWPSARTRPWPPLHVELGYRREQSTVTLLRAETVINVAGGLDEVASVMGSAASLFGILHSGRPAVILSPFTARRLAGGAGRGPACARELFARGRLAADTWRRSWIHAPVRASDWPTRRSQRPSEARSRRSAAGRHHADRRRRRFADSPARLLPSWGHPPCRVTREIIRAVSRP